MAVYVVHASLLLIMAGAIVDGIFGYKGYLTLVPGKPAVSQVELRDGRVHQLPFALRCDETGQENYTGQFAAMPKRWWSKLAVVENGREVEQKEIEVNDPLVYRGVRFYQSGYGLSSELRGPRMEALLPPSMDQHQSFHLTLDQAVQLNDGSRIKMVRFIPDAFAMDGDLFQRSKDLNNAAIKLEVAKDGKTSNVYLFRSEEGGMQDVVLVGPYDATGEPATEVPYRFVASLEMAPYTGLQVSHEPGEGLVWTGCILMAAGLMLAFWVLHQRYWAAVVTDERGCLRLWLGAAANKKREAFEQHFRELASEVEKEIGENGVAV